MKKGKSKIKVFVAMSGGVDSSTTAWLLKKAGYDLIGIFMRLGDNQATSEAAGRRVCHQLGIKFYPLNLTSQFKREIVDYFLASYTNGQTPNPCVKCNKTIKFGRLLKTVKQLGADYLATGHYVKKLRITNYPLRRSSRFAGKARRVSEASELRIKYKLLRAKDKNKDQSYFLYNLTQEQLGQVLFPLGDYTKEQIRKIANKAKLPYLTKESQDICFLAGEDHNDFLKKNFKFKKGKIRLVTSPHPLLISPLSRGRDSGGRRGYPDQPAGGEAGEVIGQHQGLPLYTIGQRRGVEIGGTGPYYVARTDYKTNTLYVVKDGNNPALYSDKLIIKDINWISGKPLLNLPLTKGEKKSGGNTCRAVIRYRHRPVKCVITRPPLNLPLTKGEKKSGGNKGYLVRFSEPQRAITPGQSVVFYQDDEVLGGGIIK